MTQGQDAILAFRKKWDLPISQPFKIEIDGEIYKDPLSGEEVWFCFDNYAVDINKSDKIKIFLNVFCKSASENCTMIDCYPDFFDKGKVVRPWITNSPIRIIDKLERYAPLTLKQLNHINFKEMIAEGSIRVDMTSDEIFEYLKDRCHITFYRMNVEDLENYLQEVHGFIFKEEKIMRLRGLNWEVVIS